MKIIYIKSLNNNKNKKNKHGMLNKFSNKDDEKVLMKHLRKSENNKISREDLMDKLKTIKCNSREKIINGKKCFSDLNKKNTILKKNQIALLSISLMLVTAGYMNYTNEVKKKLASNLGDAKLVSTNVVTEENNANQDETIENNNSENDDNLDENNKDDIFSSTKLERDKSYSEMLENYQKILESSSISSDEKTIATNEIKKINEYKNAINTIESLLKAKGFKDSAILVNDNSINVMIKSSKLTSEETAIIENIVSRELNADIEKIHIASYN